MKALKQIDPKRIHSLLIVGLIIISFSLSGQPLNKITFQHGGNVQLICNSMTKYNDGITLTGYTALSFSFNVLGSTGWLFQIRSSSNTIISDEGNPDIPNASFEIQVENLMSSITNDPTGTIDILPFSPDMSWKTVAEGNGGTTGIPADNVTVVIVFSYNLASMLNRHEGFYYLDLEVELVAKN